MLHSLVESVSANWMIIFLMATTAHLENVLVERVVVRLGDIMIL